MSISIFLSVHISVNNWIVDDVYGGGIRQTNTTGGETKTPQKHTQPPATVATNACSIVASNPPTETTDSVAIVLSDTSAAW
jgi:hypothetical protein